MINAKQQAIRNAYGEYFKQFRKYIDDNGWIAQSDIFLASLDLPDSFEVHVKGFPPKGAVKWRPKSLQGLENNNGWINASEELPTEFGAYHVEIENWDQKLFAYFDLTFKTWHKGDFQINVKRWQPINYPKSSIY